MAVDSGAGNSNQTNVSPSPAKRNKCPGVRVIGGRIYDSFEGKSCHQCRQKTRDFAVACTNQRNNKPCPIMYCHKCLMNRYGEKAEEAAALGDWRCPRCRGICNCSFCMKKRGCKPTGLLTNTAKASGFSSVSEMLTKGAEHLILNKINVPTEKVKENMAGDNTTSDKISQSPSKRKMKRKGLDEMHEHKESGSSGLKKPKRDRSAETSSATNNEESLKEASIHNDETESDTEKDSVKPYEKDETNEEDANMENDSFVLNNLKADVLPEIPLPIGTELQNLCGVDVRSEDVGNAVQFLEFCAVFGEILDVKKGQPELVLQDLLHGRTGRGGKFSSIVQFHIDLLSILETDQGEEDSTLSPSQRQESWFSTLKEYLSDSQSVLAQNGLDCLEKAENYETLDSSQKLTLLNVLCDEVLGTEKLRNWMDDQNAKQAEKVKESKKEVQAAKDKEKILKKKMKDDIVKSIIAGHSGALSIAEHEAVVSRIKSEVALAHAKVLESKGVVLKNNQTSDAMRIEPYFIGNGGHVYWKLNCLGKSEVLHQDIGKGDTLTLNEKWFTIDDEGKEAVQKHISACRR